MNNEEKVKHILETTLALMHSEGVPLKTMRREMCILLYSLQAKAFEETSHTEIMKLGEKQVGRVQVYSYTRR